MLRRKVFVALVSVIVVAGTVAAAMPRADAARRTPRTPRWCQSYDTLPMTDMLPAQMMDEATFYPAPKGPLGTSDCRQVVAALRRAKKYALQFPTAADAMAAGFRMVAPYVRGQGAHYVGPQGIFAPFDPTTPNLLLYGGNGPNAPLVGLSWLVSSGQTPPPGMPGGNDHWHRHRNVCMSGGIIVAEEISAQACAALGGAIINISSLWLLHAWIVPGYEYPPDIFRPHAPFLT